MFPTLSIGPLLLPVPTLLLLLGIWIGFSQSEKYADFFGVKQTQISSLLIYFLIASLLGARLSYIASFPTAFSNNWLSIVSPNPNMMDWPGGLLIGAFTAGIFISRLKLDIWKTLDALTPGMLIFFLFLGFSFLASGQFYGNPTDLPWAINLWGINRHPTQIYWIIMAGGLMVFIWPRQKAKWYPGVRFLSLVSLFAVSLLLLYYFKADDKYISNGLRSAQVISFVILAIMLWQLRIRIRKFQSELKKEI